MKSVVILSLLALASTQSCTPLGAQSNSVTSGQLAAFASVLKSAQNSQASSANPGLTLACNSVTPVATTSSAPISTTIKITGTLPTGSQGSATTTASNLTPYVGGPAYYQATGSFPWGGLTPMTFDTTNYVRPTTTTTTTTTVQSAQPVIPTVQPVQPVVVQPTQPIQPTLPILPIQPVQPNQGGYPILNQSLAPAPVLPHESQFNQVYTSTQTVTQNIPQVQTIPQVTTNVISTPIIPQVTLNPVHVTVQSTPAIPVTQFVNQTFSTGSNLIPIVGDTPVPVSFNNVVSTQVVSNPNVIQTAPINQIPYVPVNVATSPAINIPIPTQTNFISTVPVSNNVNNTSTTYTTYSTTTSSSPNNPIPVTLPAFIAPQNLGVSNGNNSYSFTATNTVSPITTLPAPAPINVASAPSSSQNNYFSSIINSSASEGFNAQNLGLDDLFRDYGAPQTQGQTTTTTTTTNGILNAADLATLGCNAAGHC